jgi:hypothetical protein
VDGVIAGTMSHAAFVLLAARELLT